MREALRLAALGERDVSPNPMVGAVLVKGGRIVARGYHRRYGGAHAEVDCLSRYGGPLHGATLYVTLEPCSHFGKTPPCAPMLAATPIRRVVVAMKDPNPIVGGKGIGLLRRAGKRVDVGVLRDEATRMNRKYLRAIASGRPYVHVKVAQTLDGKITSGHGRRRWISGPESRRRVHRMRAECDAVLVGASTVLKDNPRLTVRGVEGRNPDVVVLDGRLRIQESARLFSFGRGRRLFICASASACRRQNRKVQRLERRGATILSFPGRGGRLSLGAVLNRLYKEQVGSVLVEGGADVFGQFVNAGCADELSLFVAPSLGRGGLSAFSVDDGRTARGGRVRSVSSFEVARVGTDLLLHALFD